jgi:hypothetical protein
MRPRKPTLISIIAALALCFAPGAAYHIGAGQAFAASVPRAAHPTATAATTCTHDVSATIGGKHKCLGVGEYCATRYEHQYERYGFECSRRYSPPRLIRHR